MKIIEMTLSNGDVWAIPAWFIADNRARYYANIDEDTTYEDEYAFAMESDYELTDWAGGNMNWVDVERVASFLRPGKKPDMQDEWLSASKEVAENPQTTEPDMADVKRREGDEPESDEDRQRAQDEADCPGGFPE